MSLKDGAPLTIPEALGVMYQAVDTLKRPVMEESSAREAKFFAFSNGTIINHEPNKNQDLRRGLPTNYLALADILPRLDDFLGDLVWVHRHVLAENPNKSVGLRALISGWIANCVSSFGINRVDDPFPITAVPVEASHLFKVSLGLRGVASGLVSEASPTGERYFQAALSERLLVNGGVSCPASRNLIVQSSEALVNGIGPQPSARMDQLFPDFRSLQSYSEAFFVIAHISQFPKENMRAVTARINAALGRF